MLCKHKSKKRCVHLPRTLFCCPGNTVNMPQSKVGGKQGLQGLCKLIVHKFSHRCVEPGSHFEEQRCQESFHYSKYSPPCGYCWGCWAKGGLHNPHSPRALSTPRFRHQANPQQRWLGRGRKERHSPHSRMTPQTNPKSTQTTCSPSPPHSKLFQIKTGAKLATERNLASSRWWYSFLNSFSESGSSLKSKSFKWAEKNHTG